jgi:hypothetical protein
VASRSSKLCVDDGRYSYEAVEPERRGVGVRNLTGSTLRVLAAVRAMMAARCGALERSAVLSLAVVLRYCG